MNRQLVATIAVGAASTIALDRFAGRPALAASAAAGLAADGAYATLEPDLVIVLALAPSSSPWLPAHKRMDRIATTKLSRVV